MPFIDFLLAAIVTVLVASGGAVFGYWLRGELDQDNRWTGKREPDDADLLRADHRAQLQDDGRGSWNL